MKIKIYQINRTRDKDSVRFLPYAQLEDFQGTAEINTAIYDEVYDGEVDCKTLEDVFAMFNLTPPKDYCRRSLSVSDIVTVLDNPEIEPGNYFCDRFSWVLVEFNWKPVISNSVDNIESVKEIQRVNTLDAETSQKIRQNLQTGEGDSDKVVTIDGIDFYVLNVTEDRALLLEKDVEDERKFDANSNAWKGSNMETYLNSEWLEDKPLLSKVATMTDIKTRKQFDVSASAEDYDTTQDKVFLLSEADVFGTFNGKCYGGPADINDYTLGTPKIIVPEKLRGTRHCWWLRSPCGSSVSVALVYTDGSSDLDVYTDTDGVRPALFVNLASR